MNVGCTSDRLRKERCSAVAFHIIPSDAMARDALALARSSSNAVAQAWDTSLTRFGADTLNQRFLTRFHEPMTSAAWASWFAVKVIWESALRQKSADAQQIADYLVRETTQFDGHKGTPLSFRSWDHQLRQPLYVASGAGPSRQIPEVAGDESVRDALDQLGQSTRSTSCGRSHE
jgi:ABC transporter substrate binding protein (PQQ-dependent alcohol dehydrogenase system)